MDKDKIGDFIKELRQNNNMSQNDLAEIIPISREAISKWECGRTSPEITSLLRLCEIFDVKLDELMYGERRTKENEKELNKIQLKIYNDKITTEKNLNKIKKKLLIIKILFVSVIIILIAFLIYYFFNTYDSVKVYTIESNQDNIYLTDGLITSTKEVIYFKIGNIHGIDENKISKLVLYYNNNDNKKIIYTSTSTEDELIRDYDYYNEYFETNDKMFDFLFIDIYYDNQIKTLKLIIKEDYSNKRLFFNRRKEALKKIGKTNELVDNKIINKIKEKSKKDKDGVYYQEIKINKINYKIRYIENTNTLLIHWKKENNNYSITYLIIDKIAIFNIKENDSEFLYECRYEENSKLNTTCNNNNINSIKLIINEITK